MPFEFTEEDFAPKSKFDFTEQDFAAPQPETSTKTAPPPLNPLANPLAESAVGTAGRLAAAGLQAFNPFKPRGWIDAITGGALPTPEVLSKPLATVPPAVWETLPITELGKELLPTQKGKEIAAGLEKSGTDLASFFTSPIGIATLGTGALPAAAQRAIGLGFSSQMLSSVPDIAKQLGTELGNPEKERDYKKISELTANAFANTALGAWGAAHGLRDVGKPVTEVAQPKETDASIIETPAEVHGDVLPQPIEGERQVSVKEGEPRVQPQTEGRIQKETAVTPTVVDEPTGPGESARFTTKLPEGYATGFIKEGKAELVGIEVEKAARRQGVGERLLRNFSEKAQQSGAKTITGDFVPAAKSLMDKVFGKPVSEAPVPDWPEGMGEPPLRSEYKIPEYAPKETPNLEAIGSMSGEQFFNTGEQWAKEAMSGKGKSLQVRAEQAAVDNPDIAQWLKQVEALNSKRESIMGDIRKDPSKMMQHQKELMGLAQKQQFLNEGLKIIRGQKVPEKEVVAPAAKPTEPTPIPQPEKTPAQEAAIADTPTSKVLANQSPHSGLPPGVPDRGPKFPAELMEGSRQLGALVRSRATLRPGVRGQFVRSKLGSIKQADRIEVGDIRNQLTVAHEMGHSLDGILWPNADFGESQKSLADRVGTGTGKEIHNELVTISEHMRGPIVGSKGHQQYRRSATELIADYFALYLHDPVWAKSLAPKFTKGVEQALSKDYNTQQIVQQISLFGEIKPTAPDPTLKKALAGITGTPAKPGAPMPGAVPAQPPLTIPTRLRLAAVAAETWVKDAVRTFEAKVQGARIKADTWRKLVPKQQDRNDVGAFVEGIRNLEMPGDTIDRVKTRMTPAKEDLVKKYRFETELHRQEINQYLKDTEQGEYLKFLEDYLGHFYVDSKPKLSQAVNRWMKESPHAKQRKLPTLAEAVDLGLKPITQDPAVTHELTSKINWQVATNRKFIAKLKDLKDANGDPLIVPWGDAPAGWKKSDNPLIQRVYAKATPGGTLLWKGGAGIHPDIWHAARQILENPTSGQLAQAFDAVNGFTRANAFAFSLFHDLTLRSAAIGTQARLTNPIRGLVRIFERDPLTGERKIVQSTRGLGKEMLQNEEIVSDAAQHGLKFSWTDSEAYQHNARTFLERAAAKMRDVPVLGKSARLARDIQNWRQEGLWKNTHDAFKVVTYHDLVSKALQDAPPGTDTGAVKERIASLLNDAYGGQEWQTKFWLSPQMRKGLSRFFLAPDWTLSTVRSVPGVSDVFSTIREQAPRIAGREPFRTPKEGFPGNIERARFWGAELAALSTATIAAQYAIFQAFGDPNKGDKEWVWQNEYGNRNRIDVTPIMRRLPWHDKKDPTRYYVNLGKRPQEVVNWFTSPTEQILSKSSRPVAEIFEQVSGMEGDFKSEWKRDHESFVESLPSRAKAIGAETLPFVFRGNQFALSVPVRKGMTKYKAQQAYESVYELAAEPNRLKSLLRGQPASEGTLPQMVEQITDAASRNGVAAEEVRLHALSVVRGHHYDEFFKAFSKGDQKKMDNEARALITLGATGRGFQESLRRRLELQPLAPQ